MTTRRSLAILAALAAVALAAVPVWAQQAPAATGEANVMITLTVGRSGGAEGNQERTYRMIGRDGARANMLMGWRTPIPTLSKAGDDASDDAKTAFVYQNIGVSADLAVRILGGGRVFLDGGLEISGIRESKKAGPAGVEAPVIGTFSQRLTVVAQEKKKIRVAEAPDPEGGTLHVDLDVDILD